MRNHSFTLLPFWAMIVLKRAFPPVKANCTFEVEPTTELRVLIHESCVAEQFFVLLNSNSPSNTWVVWI